MDFEQLKVIWDSQNTEPHYAINAAELHDVVRRRNDEFNRRESRRYRGEIWGALIFGALILTNAGALGWGDLKWVASIDWVRVPVSRWDVAALLVASALLFYYAGYLWNARKLQRRREENYAATLLGDIDRALAQTAFLTEFARNTLWRGLVPQWVAVALWVSTTFRLIGSEASHFFGALLGMLVALAIAVRWESRRIAKRFEPRRLELEALRQKLTDARC